MWYFIITNETFQVFEILPDCVKPSGMFHATLSFRRALETIVEVLLSNDYDINMVAKGYSKKGRPCRKYTVSIDDGD
jgi:hypothetical protein